MSRIKKYITTFLLCLTISTGTQAQLSLTIIRDSEIETTLKAWIEPLLAVGDMGKNSVNVVLVQSPAINAFVAGGANIFIYTGLIDRTETPEELIGVMAHELGHIKGGHLIRSRDAMDRASYETILGTVLGIGAAVLSGNGAAANAIMAGSQSLAQRQYLAHSRVNESSADQAALTYMNEAGINPAGLSSFLEKMGSNELMPRSKQDEYARTHPITSNRIEALERRIKQSPYADAEVAADWIEQHKRMKAKLLGFIDPSRVVWSYADNDSSVPARYAHTIAAYRQNNTDKALNLINKLIEQEPQNAYFWELKGQMLVDFGRVHDGVQAYKEAIKYEPESGLIRMDYGHGLLEIGQTQSAIEELNRALVVEPRSTRIHRLLARAYGTLGNTGQVALHLGEEAFLQKMLSQAKKHAQKALDTLPKDSRGYIRAGDLMRQTEHLLEQDN